MKRNLVAGALALYGVGFLVSRPTVRGTSADTTSDYSQIFDKRDAMTRPAMASGCIRRFILPSMPLNLCPSSWRERLTA